MKKQKDPNKLPILLDTNNPWQVVLIVLITLVLSATIRGGTYLIERSGAFFDSGSPSYDIAANPAAVEFTAQVYREMVEAQRLAEKAETEKKNSYIKTIEVEKDERGINVPKATEVPEGYGYDYMLDVNSSYWDLSDGGSI